MYLERYYCIEKLKIIFDEIREYIPLDEYEEILDLLRQIEFYS